jgi:hypothetical protein
VGIIPGHWLLDAEFTATSMIGFIALAGIIVRNSILLVDFTVQQRKQGVPVRDAVILSCKARTRPILITAFALVAGSSVILFDPIFQGMAVSLLFGVLVSTLLTLVVIPMGCVASRGGPPPGSDQAPAPAPAAAGDHKPVETRGGVIRTFGQTMAHVIPAVGRTFIAAVVGFVVTLGMLLKFLISKLTARKQRKTPATPTSAGHAAPSGEEKEPAVAEEPIARLEEVEEPASTPQPIPQKTPGNRAVKKATVKKKARARKKTAVKKKAPVRKKTTTVKTKATTAKTTVKTKKKTAKAGSEPRSATTKKRTAAKKAATPKKKTGVKKTATTGAKKATIKKTAAKSGKPQQTASKKKERRGIRLTPSKY